MEKKSKFIPKKLTALISLALLSPHLYSAVVRDDIDYQYFRDFAENKGLFYVNAMNIPIFNKSGKMIGRMLERAPMMDLSVADRSAVATLIHPQYVTSVAHNSGYTEVQFGAQGTNFDAHHFAYKLVDRNNYSGELHYDYHVPRLSKLVTEVAPIAVSSAGLDANQYLPQSNRFSEYVRVGSGTQYLRTAANRTSYIAGPYSYLIGGNSLDLVGNRYGWLDARSDLFHSHTGVMATYGVPGDSGSPIFAFDTVENRWVLIGVLNFHTGENASGNVFSISRTDFIKQKQDEDIAGHIVSTENNNQFTWHTNPSHRTTTPVSVPLSSAVTNNTDLSGLNAGKSVYFSGHNGELTLDDNINQGAGALYFDAHFTVKGKTPNTTWLGAGVSVAEGKEVKWQVHNPKGDRLSKIGKGILYVNGTGKNEGDISVGDGLVFLAQKADAQGNQQAFNQIGITSGRATVVIGAENQFNPNNLYFGFRGGRLDVNGHSLTFDRIQNTDDGAKIVNNNVDKSATLTIKGINLTENDIKWQGWKQQATSHLSIYEYDNTWRGHRKDYFQLVGNPGRFYPIDQNSDSNWVFLSSNKDEAVKKVLERYSKYQAFNGFLGETDFSKHNGVLNVDYDPRKEQFLLLSGGTELNGNFTVNTSTVLLSGRPTPHARDHLANRDVEKDDDWISREFNAKEFIVKNDGKFYVGRNVSAMNANITGSGNSSISVGFIQNQTPLCTRSDYTGNIQCDHKAVLSEDIFEQLPQTQLRGNIALSGNSHFSLGKAHLQGLVQAEQGTRMTLNQGSEWTLTANSQINNLEVNNNAVITLNPQFHTISAQQVQNGISQFGELTVLGNLTGNGRFNFLSNAGIEKSDKLTVHGIAAGTFTLNVKNTGAEPRSAKPLHLVSLRNSAQNADSVSFLLANHYVDLGAYRYVLKNEHNNYRLYSPVKEAVLKAYDSRPTEYAVNSALNLAKTSLDEVISLSKQIAQKAEEKLSSEHQAARKEREGQIARKKEDEYRTKARQRLLPYRKREALNLAEQAMAEANRAKNSATELTALAKQRGTEIEMMRTALAQAKQKAQEAENAALKLAFFSSKDLSAEGIVEKSSQLCAEQGIDEASCHQLLEAFSLPQDMAPTRDISQKIQEIKAKLAQKRLEKQGLQSSLAVYDQAVFKENANVKYYKDKASRRWFKSGKEKDLELAYQASLRAQNKLQEREKVAQKLTVLDNEIALLQHSLQSAESLKANLPAAPSLEDMALENAMLKVDSLSAQYDEAKANFDKIMQIFENESAGLSAQELANRQTELEKARASLSELATALENAKDEEAETLFMLRNTMLATASALPVAYNQRDVISQYANSALSDASAQINSLLHINQEVHNRLIASSDKNTEVWANYAVMNNQYSSNLFRNYSQRIQLNQIGIEHKVTDGTHLGAIFSQSRNQNQFDDGFNGKARLNMLTLYAKRDFGYGITGAIDFSYGQTKNRIYQGDLDTNFKRHIYEAGVTLAKKWQWNGISIQPALNAHYQHISSINYGLELANIENAAMNFFSYGASLKIAKTFDFNGIKVTPSWQSQYIDASHKDFTLKVNEQALQQKFGRYTQHQFDLAFNLKNWAITARVGLLNGNQTKSHKFASLNVGYSW